MPTGGELRLADLVPCLHAGDLVAAEAAHDDQARRLGGASHSGSPAAVTDALEGRTTLHHRFLIRWHLRMIEELEAAVAAFDVQIGATLAPF